MELKLINANTEYEVKGPGLAGESVVIGDSYQGIPITSVGKNAFANTSRLAEVRLGGNVTSIGEGAFKNCPNLVSVHTPFRAVFL